jgi:quercetin dioxygenase-like cupin family protein
MTDATEPTVTHARWDDVAQESLNHHIDRRMVTGQRLMVAQVMIKKGGIVPMHAHENEQLTQVIEGALRFWIGSEDAEPIDVRAGEILHIPSNVPHKAEALEDTNDVDVFTPPRQDWLDGTDSYLRDE